MAESPIERARNDAITRIPEELAEIRRELRIANRLQALTLARLDETPETERAVAESLLFWAGEEE